MRISVHRVNKATNIGSRLEYGAETGAVSECKDTNKKTETQNFTLIFVPSI